MLGLTLLSSISLIACDLAVRYPLPPHSLHPAQEPTAMASIERTAYPRFQPIPHARELTEYFTPTAEEIAFGHTLVQRHAAIFPVILLLKCVQYLGYFP